MMLILSYGSRDMLISDDAGDAVLEFAKALARTGASDDVAVITVASQDDSVAARLLLGPGVHIVLKQAQAEPVELDDSALIAAIHTKTAQLQVARPIPEAADHNGFDLHEFDL
jgi:hypothetical protein